MQKINQRKEGAGINEQEPPSLSGLYDPILTKIGGNIRLCLIIQPKVKQEKVFSFTNASILFSLFFFR